MITILFTVVGVLSCILSFVMGYYFGVKNTASLYTRVFNKQVTKLDEDVSLHSGSKFFN